MIWFQKSIFFKYLAARCIYGFENQPNTKAEIISTGCAKMIRQVVPTFFTKISVSNPTFPKLSEMGSCSGKSKMVSKIGSVGIGSNVTMSNKYDK